MNPIKKTIPLPDGREITLETGKLAKQADGAVELRMGNTMLLATVYFSSLLFFVIEHDVNPLVVHYTDALWWAFMDVTTVGSNIYAVTATGKILSVVLAALGMMMFPIFTVYVTNWAQQAARRKDDA